MAALSYVVSVGTAPTLLVDSSPNGHRQRFASGAIVRTRLTEIRTGGPTVTWTDGMYLLPGEVLEWDQQWNVDLWAVCESGTVDVNVELRSGLRGDA